MGVIDHDGAVLSRSGRIRKRTGMALFMLAITAFVACVGSFALKQVEAGVSATIVALLAAAVALAWLTMEGRRVRQVQRETAARGHRVAP